MRQTKPEGPKAKKRFVLLSCVTCLLCSIWYLNHTDTSDTPLLAFQEESKSLHSHTHNELKPLNKSTQNNESAGSQTSSSKPETNSTENAQFPKQEKLLAAVMENFKEMEQILDNIDHPSVQEFMAALPPESQKSLRMEALKQSVSKRLDIVEANPLSPIDLKNLNQDIDKLAENFVMMPEEARNLKAYLQQHTKS